MEPSPATLHCPLPARARQEDGACAASCVPAHGCQQLAHLPTDGEVNQMGRVGKAGSPLLCPSSPPRVALPIPHSPCASILPSLPASFPASSSPSLHPGMQGGPDWAQRGWMHPEHFLPLACGVRDPAGAAGGAGEGSCPLARALPCSTVPHQPGGAGDAAGLDTAAGTAAENPGSGAAGRPSAALLQGLLSHDVSGHEPSGLLL